MVELKDKYYRIIIIGAGFSKPAGLPLGKELFDEIIQLILHQDSDTPLRRSFDYYIKYFNNCNNTNISPENVDIEDFISFLDIEHYLGLKGSDTWSNEGNKAQLAIKDFISHCINRFTPNISDIPDFYFDFVERLQPDDYILTFNYDILLEKCFKHLKKPFRLFPSKYKSVNESSGTVDHSKEEVIILKFHGSIDWFDKTSFIELENSFKKQGYFEKPKDAVFTNEAKYNANPIVDGPRFKDDPLKNVYRITDVEDYYSMRRFNPPFILSPSKSKILYSPTVHSFWYGLNKSGATNLGMSIIGFSLPNHDEYIKQGIYALVRNYQEYEWDYEWFGNKKTKLKLIDIHNSETELNSYKERYQFIDYDKSEIYSNGFDTDAVKLIFKKDH